MNIEAKREGNAVTVLVPMKEGTCDFAFTAFAVSGRRLEGSVLATVRTLDGKWVGGLSQFADVRDGRAREQFARTLRDSEVKAKWSMVVSAAFAAFESEWRRGAASKVVRASEVELVDSRFLLEAFIEEGVPNLLHAVGGVGKTFFSLAMGAAVANGSPFLGAKSPVTGPVLFVDYENSARDWRRRMDKLSPPESLDNFLYVDSEGVPMHEMADNVADIVRREGVRLVIVDSAGPACGGKPEEASNATLYFSALRSLGITTLTIAHEAKHGDGTTPFGSAYFGNLPRNVWSMRKSESGVQSQHIKTLELTHRKYNNGPLRPPVTFEMKEGLKAMTFERVDAESRATLAERVVTILRRDESATAADITSELTPVTRHSVNSALGRLRENGAAEHYKGKWKLKKPL